MDERTFILNLAFGGGVLVTVGLGLVLASGRFAGGSDPPPRLSRNAPTPTATAMPRAPIARIVRLRRLGSEGGGADKRVRSVPAEPNRSQRQAAVFGRVGRVRSAIENHEGGPVGEERHAPDEDASGGTEVEAKEKEERGLTDEEELGDQSSSKTRLDAVGDPDKPGVGPPPPPPKPG
jgi:hypothetical protein